MELTTEVYRYIEEHRQEAFELLTSLAQIPSPSGHEEQRAIFCRDWLMAQGAVGVYIDEAQNVLYPVGSDDGPLYVIAAHSDVVFPDTEPLPMTVTDEKICCPGVGDDTANVVALLMVAKYIAEKGLSPMHGGLLLAVDAGEEGLGNLKGIRAITDRYGGRMAEFISFDCSSHELICRAVGSKRYRIAVDTQGGHSYFDFGNRNAIAELSTIVAALYKMPLPQGGHTTYNVGTIEGGTSVNTIAQHAQMLFEFRSDDRDSLERTETMFWNVIEQFRSNGMAITVFPMGDRPCSGAVDPEKLTALCSRSAGAIRKHFGWVPVFKSGSTDCNIPLSMGIPSVSFGCLVGGGMHTREEYVDIDSLHAGWRLAFETVLFYI